MNDNNHSRLLNKPTTLADSHQGNVRSTLDDLRHVGLVEWVDNVYKLSESLSEFVHDDMNIMAGLAAIMMVNFKSINSKHFHGI